MRVIETFPNQKFVFFGDNSQQDPTIYAAIAEKYPEQIAAIYIHNVYSRHVYFTEEILEKIRGMKIPALQFNNSKAAMDHSRQVGILEDQAEHPVENQKRPTLVQPEAQPNSQ